MALFFYKEKNKDIRAAAYLRLSIEDGDKAESNSIGNQRELIRDFAAERPGLHLVEEYADDGYTGTNFERPGFKRMMEDIKSGKINCIIVKDLSRLGRNYIEMGKYLEQIFPMMGIRFIAINDNYDNANTESSDSDSIVVPFKNLLNDSYCRDISIKVRSQLDMKRRKGEFIGGYAIYGYCKDERNKNRLVVDEYAADIVRSIYRRKLEGMSAQAIAEQLNSENVLAPSEYKRLCGLNYHSGFKAGTHAKWQAIQVLRILKNEIYTGTMVQGRRQKINYKIKKIRDVEESGWIRVPNMHEAIIPQKLFDTVQEAKFERGLGCPCWNTKECAITWATDQPERGHYESNSMAVKIGAGDDNSAATPCGVAGEVVCGIFASLFCVVFLSARQCVISNGGAFIPPAAVAGDGSISNDDRWIRDFYDRFQNIMRLVMRP